MFFAQLLYTLYNKTDVEMIFTILVHTFFFFTFTKKKKKKMKIISTSALLYKACTIHLGMRVLYELYYNVL